MTAIQSEMYLKKSEANDFGRKCSKCKTWKEWDNFSLLPRGIYGHNHTCSACLRDNKLKLNYNINQKEYDWLLNQQGGHCALCDNDTNYSKRALSVDHDHSCCNSKDRTCGRCIRGILCNECNHMLGLVERDLESFASAKVLAYIDRRPFLGMK